MLAHIALDHLISHLPDKFAEKRDYLIAWVLPSYDQEAIARPYFDEISSQYSSTDGITYTFGRVGTHNVVLASPASSADLYSTDYIVRDLLKQAPCIRAGFLVSSDAAAPRGGVARVGDVVVAAPLPLMQRGVIYLDTELTKWGENVVTTGESRNVSPAVVEAVKMAKSPQGLEDWKISLYKHVHPSQEERHDIRGQDEPQRDTPSRDQPEALLGVIATSKQHIKNAPLRAKMASAKKICCFETSAATLGYGPFLVLAPITRYCDDVQGLCSHKEPYSAAISYLAPLTTHIDLLKLKFEPPIEHQFQYEPFDLDQPAFRLLRLQGGHGRLRCHIFQAYLDDQNLIPYEALSYCWGSNRLTHTIQVNGGALAITSNLCSALTHLRHHDKDRILWIDAICIDQGNVRERGHQVDHMGDVYRRADQVLFWLGYVDYDIAKLLSQLQLFERDVPIDAWKRWPNGDSRFQAIWDESQDSLEERNQSKSSQQSRLETLMNTEWFGRVWVIQEVFNAKRASLGCTAGWVNARAFALAPALLEVEPNAQCQAIIDVMPGPIRKYSWWNQKPNLSTLLWKFRESQAGDSRDRVFALLDIAADKPFKSDYSKTEHEVVKNVMAYICRDTKLPQRPGFLKIEELQKLISSLLYLDMDQFASSATHLDVMERFTRRSNKQVFLSEAAIGYLWFTRSPLREQLMHDSSIVQVVSDQISESDVARSTESLAAYLKRHNGPKIDESTLIASQDNGFDFRSMMLEQKRDDIEISEFLTIQAAKKGGVILEQFLSKYGDQVVLTQSLKEAAAGFGLNLLDLVVDKYNGRIRITDTLLIDAIQRGPEMVERLLNMYRHRMDISETAILKAFPLDTEMLKPLLHECGEHSTITSTVPKAAIKQYSLDIEVLVFLLNRYGDSIQMPAHTLDILWRMGKLSSLTMLLDRCGNRDDVLRALLQVEDKWVFRWYAARTLVIHGWRSTKPWFRVLAPALRDVLAQKSQLFAMLMAGDFNELLLDPGLLL